VEKIVFLCFLVAVIVLLAELYRAPEAQAQQ
jgi:preprotein translocase subunit Sec61beta